MEYEVQRRRLERAASFLVETQQAHEHRRYQVGVMHFAVLQRLQRIALVEALVDQDRGAVQLIVDREHQRGGVVDRAGDEVGPRAIERNAAAVAARAVECGGNRIVGVDPERITAAYRDVVEGRYGVARTGPLWDGRAAERIVDVLVDRL